MKVLVLSDIHGIISDLFLAGSIKYIIFLKGLLIWIYLLLEMNIFND